MQWKGKEYLQFDGRGKIGIDRYPTTGWNQPVMIVLKNSTSVPVCTVRLSLYVFSSSGFLRSSFDLFYKRCVSFVFCTVSSLSTFNQRDKRKGAQ